MKRISFICLLLFIGLVSFIPNDNNNLVGDILSQTNSFRKSQGLPVLIIRPELNSIAQQHSADMARGRVAFGHDGFDQRYAMTNKKIQDLHRFAENVAVGAKTASEVFSLWKNSPGHRRNMLGRFQYIGIGTAKDNQGRIFYTEVFAG